MGPRRVIICLVYNHYFVPLQVRMQFSEAFCCWYVIIRLWGMAQLSPFTTLSTFLRFIGIMRNLWWWELTVVLCGNIVTLSFFASKISWMYTSELACEGQVCGVLLVMTYVSNFLCLSLICCVQHYVILDYGIMTHSCIYNTLRLRQDGHHFPDDIFKCILLNKDVLILLDISLKFVPKGQINYIPALVQIMDCCQANYKPLSELLMVNLLMHICITWSQWVNAACVWHIPGYKEINLFYHVFECFDARSRYLRQGVFCGCNYISMPEIPAARCYDAALLVYYSGICVITGFRWYIPVNNLDTHITTCFVLYMICWLLFRRLLSALFHRID